MGNGQVLVEGRPPCHLRLCSYGRSSLFGSNPLPGLLYFDQCGRKKGDCCSRVVHTGHQRVTFLYNGNFSDSRRLGPLSAKVHTHDQCGPDAGLLETSLLIPLEPACSYFLSYKC